MTALGFSLYIGRGGLWLRIPTGHGFSLAWDNPRPLFSERSGKRRVYRVGRLAFQWLKVQP